MKKISMLIVALLVAVASHAQFEQGKWYVGAAVSISISQSLSKL